MTIRAAKGRKLLSSFAAVCVLAALGAALPTEASRYLPPLAPHLAPAPPVLEAAPQPARSLSLFTDDDVLVLTACSELDENEVDQLLEPVRQGPGVQQDAGSRRLHEQTRVAEVRHAHGASQPPRVGPGQARDGRCPSAFPLPGVARDGR